MAGDLKILGDLFGGEDKPAQAPQPAPKQRRQFFTRADYTSGYRKLTPQLSTMFNKQQHESGTAHQTDSRKTKRTNRRVPRLLRRRAAIPIMAISLSVILVMTSAIVYTQARNNANNPITKSLKQQSEVPLYYPAKLPKGYKIAKDGTTTPDKGVVLFTITNAAGKKFYMSQQKLQPYFEFDQYFGAFSEKKEISVPAGKVTMGIADDKAIVSSLITEKSWIILNSQADLSVEDATLILKNLKPS